MMRSSVVLPEPDGPSSAISFTRRDVEVEVVAVRRSAPKRPVEIADFEWTWGLMLAFADRRASAPFDTLLLAYFSTSVTSASSASSDADREGRDELVFVVEDLDVQRHRVGLAADVTRDHAHRAELAHRPGVAEQHAVQQRPSLMFGSVTRQNDLPAAGAE